jgi:hypothetical protein
MAEVVLTIGIFVSLFPGYYALYLYSTKELRLKEANKSDQNAILQKQEDDGENWICKKCLEPNDISFEICWNCQSVNT